jgi:predicted nucleic acid-binding protein
VSAEFLLDNSAWARLPRPDLPDSRAIEIGDDLEANRLAVSLPFLLEAGVSAISSQDHAELLDELLLLPFVRIDQEVERRAFEVQSQLARIGHHKVPPVDLMIAALADRHGLGVLHYDGDYDMLAEKTGLDFHSQWLMPRGSID